MNDRNLEGVGDLPAHVRSDYLRVLDWSVAEMPKRWRSRLGVPVLWLTLGGSGDADLEVERTDVYELAKEHGYPDEFHRWVRPAVRSRVRQTGARCAALICHGGMSSPFQGPIVRTLMGLPDRHAHVHAAHRDDQETLWVALSLRRGPLRRIRFTPEVHQRLADVRRRT